MADGGHRIALPVPPSFRVLAVELLPVLVARPDLTERLVAGLAEIVRRPYGAGAAR